NNMTKKITAVSIFFLSTFIFGGMKFSSCSGQNEVSQNDFKISDSLKWSERLTESFLIRHPGSVTHDEYMTKNDWNYEQGVVLEALRQMYFKTGDKKYFNFIKENIDQFVTEEGKILEYEYNTFNIDNINTGRQLLFLYKETGIEKYKIAADTLRKQLQNQPRTNEGGFWHKKIYPYQMWLDGIYMSGPFYAQYISMFEKEKNYDDVVFQITTVYKHTLDEKTGLLYHAWNENKEQKWADPVTGTSKHFWGRAIGWYLMAIVDVLDILPEDHPKRGEIIHILQNVSEAVINFRDKDTGLWYQILDMQDREGNYLEASCATMFTYAFAKGANKGYLDKKFYKIADESFESIIKTHVEVEENGFVNLLNTCKGAGLGGN
ncbi:MAG: glycoside hydrolase family 88 protein, partial [Melioribacteraceae bacterium]